MVVRVMKGRNKWVDYTCAHISQDLWDNGIDLILWEVDGKPNQQKTIQLPEHTKKVFSMEHGETIHCWTWPPKVEHSEQ